MSSKASQIQKNHPVVKCESVYKIFGENAEGIKKLYFGAR